MSEAIATEIDVSGAPPRMTALVDARTEPHVRDALGALGLVAIVLVADADGDLAIGKVAQDDKLRALVNSLRAFSKAAWVEAVWRVWVPTDDAADEIIETFRARFDDVKLGGSGRRWFEVDVVTGQREIEVSAAERSIPLFGDAVALARARVEAKRLMARV